MRRIVLILIFIFSTIHAKKVALVLSGGVARGLAHIGVLKVLKKYNIYPDLVVGNSMGAIVGGLYAAGYSPEELEYFALHTDWAVLFSEKIPESYLSLEDRRNAYMFPLMFRHQYLNFNIPQGLLGGENILLTFEKLTGRECWEANFDFDNLKTPFRAVATDIITGKEVIIKKGRLSVAMRASSSLPGIFDAVEMDSLLLVDGVVVDNLPVSVARKESSDVIIAVDVGLHIPSIGFSIFEIISNTLTVISNKEVIKARKEADILVSPYLKDFAPMDFSDAKNIIKQGEIAALSQIDTILKIVPVKTLKYRKREIIRHALPVANIKIRGNKFTWTWIIRKLIHIKRGDTLIPERIYKDMVSLYKTGIFRKVDYSIDTIKGSGLELTYRVEERPTGIVGFGITYDYPHELTALLGVHQGNILGWGINAEMDLGIGWNSFRQFLLSSSDFLGFPFGFRVYYKSLYTERSFYKEHVWAYSFRQERRKAGAEIGYASKNNRLSIGFANMSVKNEFPSNVINPPANIMRRVFATLRLEAVNLDRLFLPTRGFSLSVNGGIGVPVEWYGYVITNLRFVSTMYTLSWDTEIDLKMLYPFDRDFNFNELFANKEGFGFYRDEFYSYILFNFATGPRIKLMKIFSSPVYIKLSGVIFATDFKDFGFMKNYFPGANVSLDYNSPIGPLSFGLGWSFKYLPVMYLRIGSFSGI